MVETSYWPLCAGRDPLNKVHVEQNRREKNKKTNNVEEKAAMLPYTQILRMVQVRSQLGTLLLNRSSSLNLTILTPFEANKLI